MKPRSENGTPTYLGLALLVIDLKQHVGLAARLSGGSGSSAPAAARPGSPGARSARSAPAPRSPPSTMMTTPGGSQMPSGRMISMPGSVGVGHVADRDREHRLALLVQALLDHLAGPLRALGRPAATHRPVLKLPDLDARLGGRRRRRRRPPQLVPPGAGAPGCAPKVCGRHRSARSPAHERCRRQAGPGALPRKAPRSLGRPIRSGRRSWAQSGAKLSSLSLLAGSI